LGPRLRSVLCRIEPVAHYAIVHIHNRPSRCRPAVSALLPCGCGEENRVPPATAARVLENWRSAKFSGQVLPPNSPAKFARRRGALARHPSTFDEQTPRAVNDHRQAGTRCVPWCNIITLHDFLVAAAGFMRPCPAGSVPADPGEFECRPGAMSFP
jgi:hypothetical protein